MKLSGRRGLSLIEVMVAIGILAIVASSLYMILANAGTTYGNLTHLADAQERARRVMDEMAKELRMADLSTLVITPAATGDTVSFRIPDVDPRTGLARTVAGAVQWSPTIQYAYQLSFVDANHNNVVDEGRVVRIQNGQTQRLCDYVRSGGLKFTRTGENLVIDLIFISILDRNRVVDTPLRSSVTLRNGK